MWKNSYQSFNFTIKVGGWGGFFASVRACGVTGQQQQGSVVSAELIVRGGAGGGFLPEGGDTNPSSSLPSPVAKTVPMHNVDANSMVSSFLLFIEIFREMNIDCLKWSE